MPSIDDALLGRLCESGQLVCIAEQNNGFILQGLQRLASRPGHRVDWTRVLAINTLDAGGRPLTLSIGVAVRRPAERIEAPGRGAGMRHHQPAL